MTRALLVGKYLLEHQEILNLLGDRSLGLIHFEKIPKGARVFKAGLNMFLGFLNILGFSCIVGI